MRQKMMTRMGGSSDRISLSSQQITNLRKEREKYEVKLFTFGDYVTNRNNEDIFLYMDEHRQIQSQFGSQFQYPLQFIQGTVQRLEDNEHYRAHEMLFYYDMTDYNQDNIQYNFNTKYNFSFTQSRKRRRIKAKRLFVNIGKIQQIQKQIESYPKYHTKIEPLRNKIKHLILDGIIWQEDIPEETRGVIKDAIVKVYKRTNYNIKITIRFMICLNQYQDRIGRFKFDIGRFKHIKYRIRMKDNVRPRHQRISNLPKDHEEEIVKTVQALLEAGLIERYEGPWGSRSFVVYNGDGTTRMVIDYTYINNNSYSDSYPCPSVNDTLSRFNGKTIFSSFDIIKAFFNVPVAEESKPYTAFTCKLGTFVWNVMPFGGKCSPATWARASDEAFQTCRDMIKYVDDIILASKAENGYSEFENHMHAIESFFRCLEKYNLKIKISKCDFFIREVKFLGNIINKDGRRVDNAYIKRLLEFRQPKDRKELKAYLGAIEWICKFIFGMKKLMKPLHKLLKKDTPWKWTKEEDDAWRAIQLTLNKNEILHHPDGNKEFVLYTDASKYYYSGVLLQEKEQDDGKKLYVVIDMFSKAWTESERKKHITTKELLAIVYSIKHWRQHLQLQRFTIHSDANNLRWLFRRTNDKLEKSVNLTHMKWVALLEGFTFVVKHVPGVQNKIADYLSRYVDNTQLKNFTPGNRDLKAYNAHKRMKFIRKRHKPQYMNAMWIEEKGKNKYTKCKWDQVFKDEDPVKHYDYFPETPVEFRKAMYYMKTTVDDTEETMALDQVFCEDYEDKILNFVDVTSPFVYVMCTVKTLYEVRRSKRKRTSKFDNLNENITHVVRNPISVVKEINKDSQPNYDAIIGKTDIKLVNKLPEKTISELSNTTDIGDKSLGEAQSLADVMSSGEQHN